MLTRAPRQAPATIAPLLSAFAFIGMSACAFDDGTPIATWQTELTASFDASGRGTLNAFVTSDDYEVSIQSLSVGLSEVALEVAPGAVSTSFNPSDPPPGFGLCHNGHCHADDGSLVPYEEIQASLAGAQVDTLWFSRMAQVIVPLDETEAAIALEQCEVRADECWLPTGQVTRVRVTADSVTVTGEVRDLRSADPRIDGRQPFEIVATDVALELTSPLDLRVGGRADPAIYTDVNVALPATAFDALPWQSPPDLASTLISNLLESNALRVSVERRGF